MNIDVRLGFVILHYLTIELTLDCIESIITHIDTDNYCIVVVDNGSNDGSGEKLQERYKRNEKVKVIINKENLGFARGNNVGFRYAKEVEKCQFICMLNNDTLLEQENFWECVYSEYQKFGSGLIGPAVVLPDNSIIVKARKLGKRKMYRRERRNIIIAHALLYVGIDVTFFLNLIRRVIPLELKAYYPVCVENKRIMDVVLEGCCLIFTPLYLKQFDGIDDRTFMYREEELLFVRLKKHGMKSLYSEKIQIKHLLSVTTNKISNTPRKRKMFRYQNEIKSLKILIDEMKEL